LAAASAGEAGRDASNGGGERVTLFAGGVTWPPAAGFSCFDICLALNSDEHISRAA
jgi:hypothetical protein